MMGKDGDKQYRFMFLNLEDYVPNDHLLRKILTIIDFSFVYEKVKHLYSNVGRRSVDPVLLIKMLLLGYLYGIPSERKLEEEVKLNLAYRWFLGLDLVDSVPDHSTLSQNRRRRFKNSGIFDEIFNEIVKECVAKKLVTGEIIVTDSTHIKASASSDKVETLIVEKTPSEYLVELEKAAQQIETELQAKREARGKKKCEKKPKSEKRSVVKKVASSTTDPAAGLLNRPGKPGGFHYLAHTSIDPKHGIITDVHVTPGNVNDHEPYVQRIEAQESILGIKIQKVGADKGYDYAEVHYGLEILGIEGYIACYQRNTSYETIKAERFIYDTFTDTYTCPGKKKLHLKHINRQKGSKIHKVYTAKTKDCKNCIYRPQCFGKSAKFRTINRPLFKETFERNKERAGTAEYKKIQRLRKIWCEGTFGTLKEQHNLRRTYKRGIENAKEHCLLSALAINLKRMVKAIA